jgi:hypothetical protein
MCACVNNDGQNKSPAEIPDLSAQAETPVKTPDTEEAAKQPPEPAVSELSNDISGEVVITFNYKKQSGAASNQFAVWIEDMNGRFIKTLYATRYTADGGYKVRPDSLAIWVERSGLASMQQSEVDAITSATPGTKNYSSQGMEKLSYTWDLSDTDGGAVSPGEYKFFVEGTLRWKNYVLYSGVIEVGDAPVTVLAEAEFIYEASDYQAALHQNSPENLMISAVTASFDPAAVKPSDIDNETGENDTNT